MLDKNESTEDWELAKIVVTIPMALPVTLGQVTRAIVELVKQVGEKPEAEHDLLIGHVLTGVSMSVDTGGALPFLMEVKPLSDTELFNFGNLIAAGEEAVPDL